MIKSITFKASKMEHGLSYVSELDAIKSMGGKIEFTEGLNIIVGPNGSGKSSILNVLSHQLAANITGYSLISASWLRSITNLKGELLGCADIVHDGRPVLFCCPREGISGRRNQIDDSEFQHDILIDQFNSGRESTGEKSNRILTPFINSIMSDAIFPEKIGSNVNSNTMNDVWLAKKESAIKHWLSPQIPLGKPTLILDEPETGLSVLNQILIWKQVLTNPKVLEKYQIILVSHSIESINIPDANYIELKDGYLNACRKAISGEIDTQEIKKQATKLHTPLTKRQLNLLIEINEAEEPILHTGTKTQDHLIEKHLVELRRKSSTQDSFKNRRSISLGKRFEYCMVLTALGSQYLTMHAESK